MDFPFGGVDLADLTLLDLPFTGFPLLEVYTGPMAVGQTQWYHVGAGAPPILVCLSWDRDVWCHVGVGAPPILVCFSRDRDVWSCLVPYWGRCTTHWEVHWGCAFLDPWPSGDFGDARRPARGRVLQAPERGAPGPLRAALRLRRGPQGRGGGAGAGGGGCARLGPLDS